MDRCCCCSLMRTPWPATSSECNEGINNNISSKRAAVDRWTGKAEGKETKKGQTIELIHVTLRRTEKSKYTEFIQKKGWIWE